MLNGIIPLEFIDTAQMTAALLMKHSVHFKDDTRRQDTPGSPHHDTQSIILRGPMLLEGRSELEIGDWFKDLPHEDSELLQRWPTAKQVLADVAASHLRRTGLPAVFGKVMIASLKAGGWVDWHIDTGAYAEKYDRFHICLIPSAAAVLMSAASCQALTTGVLTWVNNRVPHSALNLGTTARVHLIIDIRKPETVN